MTKSAAQKKKSKLKKKVKKAVVKAAVSSVVPAMSHLSGKGRYSAGPMFARIKGQGGYFSDLGGKVGGVLDFGKNLLTSITGLGSYRARAHAHNQNFRKFNGNHTGLDLLNMIGGNPNPLNMGAMSATFENAEEGVVVTKREYIGDVLSSTAFNTVSYRINPGIQALGSTLFPWGSAMASLFEHYLLEGMVLEYKSTSTDFSATSALGSVTMSTIYDAAKLPLTNMVDINNSAFVTEEKPSLSFIHPIECAQLPKKYTHPDNSLSSGADERLEDVGIFQVTTIGNQVDGSKIGELWCTYKIMFTKAVMPLSSATSFIATYPLTSSGTTYPWSDVTQYVNNAFNSLSVSIYPDVIIPDAGHVLISKCPKGAYLLVFQSVLGSLLPATILARIHSGATPLSIFTSNDGSYHDADMVTTGTNLDPVGAAGTVTLQGFKVDNAGDVLFDLTPGTTVGLSTPLWNVYVFSIDAQVTSKLAMFNPKRKLDKLLQSYDQRLTDLLHQFETLKKSSVLTITEEKSPIEKSK